MNLWTSVSKSGKAKEVGKICISHASSVAQLYARGGQGPCLDVSEAVINDPEALHFSPLTSLKTPLNMHPTHQSHSATVCQPNAHRQTDMTWKLLVLPAIQTHSEGSCTL